MIVQASEIPGNAPSEYKDFCFLLFSTFMWTDRVFFANHVLRHVRIIGLNVDDDTESPAPGRKVVKLECEMEVTEAMCNHLQCMHGGCAGYLIDSLTSSVFVDIKRPTVSLNINVNYHAPAMLGSTIRVVNSSVVFGGSVVSARSHFYDLKTGKLLVSGTHSKMQPSAPPAGWGNLETPAAASPTKPIVPAAPQSTSSWRPSPRITDVKLLPGSAPPDVKETLWNIMEGALPSGLFCEDIRKTIRIQRFDVDAVAGKQVSKTIGELEVTRLMTNGMRNLHGGCACFLVDWWTASMRYTLDGNRLSINLNVSFHAPAPEGTTIQLVATSISVGKRITDSRCEILDAKTGRLLVSGTHKQMAVTKPASL
ncbi:hypothetical protein BD410DRAFT_792220 [Rickenella mellea]|uniref:Thioesterase domain-containing protein n=1 Tax=Rickenella mellea TaxID=50990 RepID=A0A4Y7PXZ2_9AGAM|nr:hypothetical protein BD410DRAFT_792220 [Rickenella mellea]